MLEKWTYPSFDEVTSSRPRISPRAGRQSSSNSSSVMAVRRLLATAVLSSLADIEDEEGTLALVMAFDLIVEGSLTDEVGIPHSCAAFRCLSSSTPRSATALTLRAFSPSGSQVGGSGIGTMPFSVSGWGFMMKSGSHLASMPSKQVAC